MINFRADRKALLATAQKALRGAMGRTTLPILNHLLLRVEGSELIITGYDLQVGVELRCPVDFIGEGSATVPADMFTKLLSSMNEGEVIVSSTKERVNLKCGGSDYKLLSLNPEEYPCFPIAKEELSACTLSASELAQAIKQTVICAAEQRNLTSGEMQLAGICLYYDNGRLTLTCSDKHVLAQKELESTGNGNARVTIPATSISAILPVIERTEDCDVRIVFFNNFVKFYINDSSQSACVVHTIAGMYPNFQRVIDGLNIDFTLQCPVLPLRDAVRRVLFVCGTNSFAHIKIGIEDKMRFSVQTRENGDAMEEIDIKEAREEPYEFWVNAKNLLNVLDAASDTTQTVQWGFGNNNKPSVIRDTDNNWMGLLMPCTPNPYASQ